MKPENARSVLLIGYGNPARQDDGLGPAAAQAVELCNLEGITVDAGYQLTVEDAAAVAEHDAVVFADAALEGAEPFCFTRIAPQPGPYIGTHSVQPAALLALAHECFGAATPGFMLAIRGYSFDMFTEELTAQARENLEKALRFLLPVLKSRSFSLAAGRGISKKTTINTSQGEQV